MHQLQLHAHERGDKIYILTKGTYEECESFFKEHVSFKNYVLGDVIYGRVPGSFYIYKIVHISKDWIVQLIQQA